MPGFGDVFGGLMSGYSSGQMQKQQKKNADYQKAIGLADMYSGISRDESKDPATRQYAISQAYSILDDAHKTIGEKPSSIFSMIGGLFGLGKKNEGKGKVPLSALLGSGEVEKENAGPEAQPQTPQQPSQAFQGAGPLQAPRGFGGQGFGDPTEVAAPEQYSAGSGETPYEGSALPQGQTAMSPPPMAGPPVPRIITEEERDAAKLQLHRQASFDSFKQQHEYTGQLASQDREARTQAFRSSPSYQQLDPTQRASAEASLLGAHVPAPVYRTPLHGQELGPDGNPVTTYRDPTDPSKVLATAPSYVEPSRFEQERSARVSSIMAANPKMTQEQAKAAAGKFDSDMEQAELASKRAQASASGALANYRNTATSLKKELDAKGGRADFRLAMQAMSEARRYASGIMQGYIARGESVPPGTTENALMDQYLIEYLGATPESIRKAASPVLPPPPGGAAPKPPASGVLSPAGAAYGKSLQ